MALGIELERLLHGETSWQYERPLRIGDELSGRTVVSDVRTRRGSRGGSMTLVTLQTDFRDQRGELVVRKHDTLIERGA